MLEEVNIPVVLIMTKITSLSAKQKHLSSKTKSDSGADDV